jgi:molybdopterin converting factor small subunit
VAEITLELHGFLADRLRALGATRGTRTIISVAFEPNATVAHFLTRLVDSDERYMLLFDAPARRLPEHVEVVLNERVLDLQGGLSAVLKAGDVLTFIPAHAGGTDIYDLSSSLPAETWGGPLGPEVPQTARASVCPTCRDTPE